MINKENGVYIQTLLDWDLKALLEQFSKEIGYSQSFIIRTILGLYLPLEVQKYRDKKEAKYETKKKIPQS